MQDTVIIHPTVLFSTLDHFKRMSSKKIIGILLGDKETHTFTDSKNNATLTYTEIHVRNSFAIPFEDQKDFWFYDTSFFEKFLKMQYKVNSSEKLLGWYFINSDRLNDNEILTKSRQIEISKSFLKFCPDPLSLEIDLTKEDIPCQVYEYKQGKYNKAFFRISPSEAEDVAIEFLSNKFLPIEDNNTMNIETVKESLLKYKENLSNILQSINKMIEKGEKNYFLMDLFQKCLNEANKLNFDLFEQNSDLNDLKSMEICNKILDKKN